MLQPEQLDTYRGFTLWSVPIYNDLGEINTRWEVRKDNSVKWKEYNDLGSAQKSLTRHGNKEYTM